MLTHHNSVDDFANDFVNCETGLHPDLITDLSEVEQESLSGGFLLFFKVSEVYSTGSSNQNSYLSSSSASQGFDNPTLTGSSNGSSNSSYFSRTATFLCISPGQTMPQGLDGLMQWLLR
jgi:hypothetical protein